MVRQKTGKSPNEVWISSRLIRKVFKTRYGIESQTWVKGFLWQILLGCWSNHYNPSLLDETFFIWILSALSWQWKKVDWFWKRIYAASGYDFFNNTFNSGSNMDPLDMAFCFATNGFTTEGSKAGAFNFFARTVDDYGQNDNTLNGPSFSKQVTMLRVVCSQSLPSHFTAV